MRTEIKLILIGIALAALLAGSHLALEHVRDQGRAEVQSAWDADKLLRAQALKSMSEQLRQTEQGYALQLAKAHNDFTEKSIQITADADRARLTTNSLRSDLATARSRLHAASTDPSGTITEYASTVSDLLERCTERYRDVADKADRHAADAALIWEAWPRAQTSDP
jgi:phosphoenolpyruvate-protein kinase (PTS system EI component)